MYATSSPKGTRTKGLPTDVCVFYDVPSDKTHKTMTLLGTAAFFAKVFDFRK
jgi:hypothetical protein